MVLIPTCDKSTDWAGFILADLRVSQMAAELFLESELPDVGVFDISRWGFPRSSQTILHTFYES
jgi:hypothetical protein